MPFLEKNWRFQKAEVDIIASKGEVLAAVEVKTRSTKEFGDPQDFVKEKKMRLLTLAINEYVEQNDLDVEVRFDIIAITKTKEGLDIEHWRMRFITFNRKEFPEALPRGFPLKMSTPNLFRGL